MGDLSAVRGVLVWGDCICLQETNIRDTSLMLGNCFFFKIFGNKFGKCRDGLNCAMVLFLDLSIRDKYFFLGCFAHSCFWIMSQYGDKSETCGLPPRITETNNFHFPNT